MSTYRSLREDYLARADGDTDTAAGLMAADLMEGDPAVFKAGYTRPNAVIAAAEYFGLSQEHVEAGLRAIEGAG